MAMTNEPRRRAADDSLDAATGPRYLYANFADSACNYGNCIIDFATRLTLRRFFPPPAGEFDSCVRGMMPGGNYEFVLVPGCTMLTVGQNPGLEQIDALGIPVYCLAGALWRPLPSAGWLLRNRVRGRPPESAVDFRIARLMTPPIGARDRDTYQLLQSAGLDSRYVGCPSLFLPGDDVGDDGYVLVSLGRGRVRAQTAFARHLSRDHQVVGICHEVDDLARYRAVGWRLPLVTYTGDIELYLSYFKRARVVITGRLHGTLPSLAYGKPVFYYGTRDSRTTLLDDLGVPIHDYSDLDRAVERASPGFNRFVAERFRLHMDAILDAVVARHGDFRTPSQPRSPGPASETAAGRER